MENYYNEEILCEAGSCFKVYESHTSCCHVPLCDEHEESLIFHCSICFDEKWCLVCINRGNGYYCKTCDMFLCPWCSSENTCKC